ncbi:MAG: Mov34/MPN/PAD-1 family protein [Anaerolineales bacterium]
MEDKQVHPLVSAGSPRRARIPHHRAYRWLAEGEKGNTGGMQVFVTQPVFRAINNHANSDLDNEVGGWLAGRWCRDIETKVEFVVVEAVLPAQQVRSGSTFLTFTHDSQVAMLAALEERYAKKGIIGWYHTHPRMGLFLSGYDTWLHQHFFPYPWQVALVVDPHTHVGGFFIRDDKQSLDARRFFGFHELLNRKGETIVDWRNLHAERKLQPKSERRKAVAVPPVEKSAEAQASADGQGTTLTPPKKTEVKVTRSAPAGTKSPEVTNDLPKDPGSKTGDNQPVEVKKVVAVKQSPSDQRQGVFKKFDGTKPPPKVNLRKKEGSKTDGSDNEAPASKEVQK